MPICFGKLVSRPCWQDVREWGFWLLWFSSSGLLALLHSVGKAHFEHVRETKIPREVTPPPPRFVVGVGGRYRCCDWQVRRFWGWVLERAVEWLGLDTSDNAICNTWCLALVYTLNCAIGCCSFGIVEKVCTINQRCLGQQCAFYGIAPSKCFVLIMLKQASAGQIRYVIPGILGERRGQ